MYERNGKHYQQTETYVNGICNAFIAPIEELKDIGCKHKGARGEAYIRIRSAYGNSYYYDITDLNMDEVAKLLASLLMGKSTKRQVTDKETIKSIEELFD